MDGRLPAVGALKRHYMSLRRILRGAFAFVTLEAGTMKEFVLWHHDVTAAVAHEPVATFAFGHQLEVATLDAVRTSGFFQRPKGRGEGHSWCLTHIHQLTRALFSKVFARALILPNPPLSASLR